MKKKISLLMADDNEEFRDMFHKVIQLTDDIEVVGMASDGLEAIEKIIELRPDVLTLDLIMPNLDGIGVLEKIQMMNLVKKPSVIVLSALGNDALIRKAMSFGVVYYFVKPIEMTHLIRQIRLASQQKKGHSSFIDEELHHLGGFSDGKSVPTEGKTYSQERHEIEVEVTTLLYEAGVPPHMVGYRYLKEAIIYCVSMKEPIMSITKELYPMIAEKFSTTPQKAERAIRNCIEKAWLRTNHDTVDSLFGYTMSSSKSKPTNAEFIATMTERVKMLQFQ